MADYQVGGAYVGTGDLEIGEPSFNRNKLAELYRMAKGADLRGSIQPLKPPVRKMEAGLKQPVLGAFAPRNTGYQTVDGQMVLAGDVPSGRTGRTARPQKQAPTNVSPWDDPDKVEEHVDNTWQTMLPFFTTVENSGAMQFDQSAGITMGQLPRDVINYFPKGFNALGITKDQIAKMNPDQKRLLAMMLQKGAMEAKEREKAAEAELIKQGKIAGEY